MRQIEQVQALTDRTRQVCKPHTRYRVLWVVGPPSSGKTTLCREVCRQMNWHYVNFTLETGYLDSLHGKELVYRPEDFLHSLRFWCSNCPRDILMLDEIEPVLGLWTFEMQNTFFRAIGRTERLEKGVVLATRLRSALDVAKLVPGHTHVFEVTEGGTL